MKIVWTIMLKSSNDVGMEEEEKDSFDDSASFPQENMMERTQTGRRTSIFKYYSQSKSIGENFIFVYCKCIQQQFQSPIVLSFE